MGRFDCYRCRLDLTDLVRRALEDSYPDAGLRPGPAAEPEVRIVEVVCCNDHANSFRLTVRDG